MLHTALQNNDTPTHQGWLIKKGNIRTNWKRRWFHLRNNEMLMSKDLKSKPFKSILIEEMQEVVEGLPEADGSPFVKKSKDQYQHFFYIITEKRTWYFQAESEKDMREWLSYLRKAKVYWSLFFTMDEASK